MERAPCPRILLTMLLPGLLAGACDWPWALDGPYDHTRCDPRCGGDEECFRGDCVPLRRDSRAETALDVSTDLDLGGDLVGQPDLENADLDQWPDVKQPPDVEAPATCVDQKKNGGETDVDCGGSSCPPCGVGKKCAKDKDCAGGACDGSTLVCLASECDQQVEYYLSGKLVSVTCPSGVIQRIVHSTYGAQIGNPTCTIPTSSKGWCSFSAGSCVGKKSCELKCSNTLCGYDPCFGYVGQCTLKVACK